MKVVAELIRGASGLLLLTVSTGCQYVGAETTPAHNPTTHTHAGRQELPSGMAAEVKGLRVVAPEGEGETPLRAFNWNPGTCVALCIVRPQGGIIGMDGDASTITAFHDNHGTDLWAGSQASRFSHSQLDMMPQVSEDSGEILFNIDAQGVPQTGSTSLTLKGEVMLLIGSEKATFTTKDVVLQKGTEFTVGERKIVVTETGAPSWGDENAFAATLQLDGDAADIVEILFQDADGNQLQAERQGTLWSGSGEHRVNHWEYVFDRRPDGPVQIGLTRWSDLTKQAVPFDLTFGAGL